MLVAINHNETAKTRLASQLDAFLIEQAQFERIARSIPLGPEEREQLGRDISRSSHANAERIIAIIGEDPASWDWATEQLRSHPVHSEHLLQSDFIARALRSPYGYAGDKDMMPIVDRNADRGSSVYAELKNHVYQSLPAAEAVRQQVRGMERHLRAMPDGAKVLCLACGPALEIQQIIKDRGRLNFQIDLLHHDLQTLTYTIANIRSPSVSHVACKAFDIIGGMSSFPMTQGGAGNSDSLILNTEAYDLVYTIGLYDYIATFPMKTSRGTTSLTTRLFSFLKPGGRLIVSNFLKPGGANLHQIPHQFMMEAYSDWRLIYRTLDDVSSFAAGIPAERYRGELLDETLARPAGPSSVIGFLVIERLA